MWHHRLQSVENPLLFHVIADIMDLVPWSVLGCTVAITHFKAEWQTIPGTMWVDSASCFFFILFLFVIVLFIFSLLFFTCGYGGYFLPLSSSKQHQLLAIWLLWLQVVILSKVVSEIWNYFKPIYIYSKMFV